MAELTPEQQALILAGVMADYALALVGGQGLNGRIAPATPDQFSSFARLLQKAAEAYIDHINDMNSR